MFHSAELTLLLLSGAGRGGVAVGGTGGVAAGSSGNWSLGLRSPGLLGTERDTPRPMRLPSVAATREAQSEQVTSLATHNV